MIKRVLNRTCRDVVRPRRILPLVLATLVGPLAHAFAQTVNEGPREAEAEAAPITVPRVELGMTIDEVRTRLAPATPAQQRAEAKDAMEAEKIIAGMTDPLTHQFTIRQDDEIVCLRAEVIEAAAKYYFVFLAGRLQHIVKPPPFEEIVEVTQDGNKVRRRMPVRPYERAQSVLDAPKLTPEAFADDAQMTASKAIQARKKYEDSRGIQLSPEIMEKLAKQSLDGHKRRFEFEKQFDPLKIQTGMTMTDVCRAFGPEQKAVRLPDPNVVEVIHVYGGDRGEYGKSSWCAVHESDCAVKAIFSHDFFVDSLREPAEGPLP